MDTTEKENICSTTEKFVEAGADIGVNLKDEDDAKTDKRATWGKNIEFFLAILGYTVGLGSIWRFPIICSRNGGGAFLIPFLLFLILAGWPLYYMEVCIGQFCGKSAGMAFSFCPLFQGLGFLQVCISFLVFWYGTQVGGWSIYYLYSSFFEVLPWTTCTNTWNSEFCIEYTSTIENASKVKQKLVGQQFANYSAQFEFWEHKVIGRSSGLDDMGHLQIHLYICLVIYMTLIVLSVIKGPKSLGKVVYVTAIAPFLLLTMIFIKGLTLDGAVDGILMYLEPDMSKLLSTQVWLDAAIQVFYSLGPSWGGVITMASYNKFHQRSFWPTALCVICTAITSFYNGLIVFTILGFMSKETGLPIQAVASQSGPGLTFVTFPVALSKMPVPQLWSVLFFLTLITVVFDSHFGTFEAVTCGIIDFFHTKFANRRASVSIVVGLLFVVTQIPLCYNGGIYIFQLCDWYFSQFALLFGSMCECIAVCWIYGTDRFCRDIKLMKGRDVSVLLRCLWTVIVPALAGVCLLVMCLKYSAPAYGDGYVYSSTALFIGVSCGLLPIVGMLIVGLITVTRRKRSFLQLLRSSIQPSKHWLPNDSKAREQYRSEKYEYPTSIRGWLRCNLIGRKNIYE